MRQKPDRRLFPLSVVAISLFVMTATSGGTGVAARERAVGPALDCPPCNDFNPCTVDTCDTTTGTCRHEALSCDDGNPCTTDTCLYNPADPGRSRGLDPRHVSFATAMRVFAICAQRGSAAEGADGSSEDQAGIKRGSSGDQARTRDEAPQSPARRGTGGTGGYQAGTGD